jgi:4-amino-4-deoxy-L-arabinose transferase-like glycosyltransferase
VTTVADTVAPNGQANRAVEPTRQPTWRRAWTTLEWFIVCLLLLYVAKQILVVIAFQPFSGHDEVAHFSYIEMLATEGRVPVLPNLEVWQAEAQERGNNSFDQIPNKLYEFCEYATVGWHCEPDDFQWAQTPPRMVTYLGELFPTGYQYTANHPPLYYALMVPVYLLSERWSPVVQQYLLRLAAIPFGLLTVFLAFRMTRELFPGDAFLAVTVPTFVAFQPQVSYEAAMVNNDIAAVALFSLLIYLVVRGIRTRFPFATCLWLGVALGLAVLAKSTSLTGAPIIAVAIISSVGWKNVRDWFLRGLCVLFPAVAIVTPWYAFMLRTYGNLDGLKQIQDLQFWNRSAGGFFELLTDREFVVMRFRETWGEFGWRLIPLEPNLLWAIAVPIILALVGLAWYTVRVFRRSSAPSDPVGSPVRSQRVALIVLGLTCAVAYLAVVQFGTQFVLTQARYFFPVVNAAALLTMLGLRTMIPVRVHRYAQGVIFGAMVALNVAIFIQYVVPQFVSV